MPNFQNDEYYDNYKAKNFPNQDSNASAGTNYEEIIIRSFTQNMNKTVFDNQDWSMTKNPIFKYYNGKQW